MRRLHVILEPRHVQRRVELQQVGERGEALVLVEVLRLQLQLLEQRGEDLRRQVGVVLQPHRGAEPAPAQALLDAGQQIDGPTSHLDVGVPRHADRVGRQDVVARVQRRQLQADHVLQQHEHVAPVGIRQRHEARQHLAGDVDHGQRALRQRRRRRRADRGDQAQRAVAEIREGMAGIDGQRRHHRQHRAAEVLLEEPLLITAEVLGPQQHDALGRQQRLDLLQEGPVLLVHELVDARRHRRQRLGGGQLVGPRRRLAGMDAALQRGHPHHEELVEVRAEDGQELHPLQQRHGGVERFLENPPVELQPGQLAIQEGVGAHPEPRASNVSCRRMPSRTPRVHTSRVR